MTNCKGTLENINRFLDNDLFGDAAIDVAAHLNRCVACRHQFDQMREIQAAMRQMPVPSDADAARERVFVRLERSVRVAESKPRSRFALPSFSWRAFAAAATTIAVVGGALFMVPHSTTTASVSLPADSEMSVLYHLHDAHGAGSLVDEPIARRDSAAEARSALLWDADSALKESF